MLWKFYTLFLSFNYSRAVFSDTKIHAQIIVRRTHVFYILFNHFSCCENARTQPTNKQEQKKILEFVCAQTNNEKVKEKNKYFAIDFGTVEKNMKKTLCSKWTTHTHIYVYTINIKIQYYSFNQSLTEDVCAIFDEVWGSHRKNEKNYTFGYKSNSNPNNNNNKN